MCLGREFYLKLAKQILPLDLLVFADIAGAHLQLPVGSSLAIPSLSMSAFAEAKVIHFGPAARIASISREGTPQRESYRWR